MATTKLNPNQLKEDTLTDADGDTLVQVEEGSDEDKIRFDTGGTERMIIDSTGVGIATSSPAYNLHVASAASSVVLIDGASNTDAILRFGQAGTLKSYIKQGSGGNLVITNETADKDIILSCKDDTTDREGLRINGDVAEVVINEGSDSLVDFRVESDSNTHMLFVDGGENKVGIGTDTPTATLHAYANVSSEYAALIDNDQSSAGHGMKITSDGTGTGTYLLDLEAASTTLFRFRADGRLGIGTTSPGQTLTVEGDIGVGTQIVHKGDSDTFIAFDTDEINIEVGGRQMIKMAEGATDKITLNNGGMDVDLQIKGENQANLIRTDAANDFVGIHTSSPGSGLHVAHSVSFSVGTLRTGAYTIAADDFCIVADCNSSAFALTLPVATDAMAGRIYTLKRMDSGDSGGGNMLTISRNGKNIDNVAGDVLLPNLEALVLQCIGADGGWIRIGSFMAPL